ncbi:MAG: UvrD-helicase domain-containing protein, partial [Sedimentibacter sp.]
MKFSSSQQEVISVRNKNILVSAAAGSGKTTVLVERIINLIINENENIDNFLIVTFTNAAASGMKQKIQKSLVKAVKKNDNKDHLRQQLNMLNKANISTIHSFCIDVVRKNFHVIGIDPNFRIGDVNEVDILLNESIDDVLESAYTKKPEGFIRLVESFTSNRGDAELNEIIKDVYKFTLSFPDPLNWLENSVEMLNMSEDDLENSVWLKAVRENAKLLLDGSDEALSLAMRLCQESDGPYTYLEAITEDVKNTNDLQLMLERDIREFSQHLHNIAFPTLKSLRGKGKDEINTEKQEDVKSLREEYKKVIANLKKIIPQRSFSEFADDIRYMYLPMQALYNIICELHENFKMKKIEKSIADFNDVEHYALEVLRQPEISETYKNKFKYIFIDEYQDSNSL